MREAPRSRRSCDAPVLKMERSTNQAYDRSVEAMAGKIWNELPVELRNAPTLSEFKRKASMR